MNIGDRVSIVKYGRLYHTYTDYVKTVVPEFAHLYQSSSRACPGAIYTIIAMADHLSNKDRHLVVVTTQSRNQIFVGRDSAFELVQSKQLTNVGGF